MGFLSPYSHFHSKRLIEKSIPEQCLSVELLLAGQAEPAPSEAVAMPAWRC